MAGRVRRVRVLVDTLKNAVTIPPAAVQRSSQGSARLGDRCRQYGGEPADRGRPERRRGMTVVTSGLKAGERVVVSGQYRLRPGVKVELVTPQDAGAEKPAGRHEHFRALHPTGRSRPRC